MSSDQGGTERILSSIAGGFGIGTIYGGLLFVWKGGPKSKTVTLEAAQVTGRLAIQIAMCSGIYTTGSGI